MSVVCATRSEAFEVNALALGGRETNGGLVDRGVGERTQIVHDEFSVHESLFLFETFVLASICTALFFWQASRPQDFTIPD